MKVHSEKYSVRYMKKIRKLQYEYADFHIDRFRDILLGFTNVIIFCH